MADTLADFDGSTAYVDAVTLIAHLDGNHPFHAACSAFMACALDIDRPVELVTAALTLDEVVFVLLQELVARPPYEVTSDRTRYLDRHPEVVRALTASLAGPVSALADLVRIEPVTAEDVVQMLGVMAATGLLPRDAIHYVIARRLGIESMASDDDAFDGLPGIRFFKPDLA